MIPVDKLRVDDVRMILRLVADIGGMARRSVIRSQALLCGLCKVLEARRAVYAVAPASATGAVQEWDCVLDVTVGNRPTAAPSGRACRWISAHSKAESGYAAQFELLCTTRSNPGPVSAPDRNSTRCNGKNAFAAAPSAPWKPDSEKHKASGPRADLNLVTCTPGMVYSIGACRAWEDGPFQSRDQAILNLFNSELAVRLCAEAHVDTARALSPRLREVLRLILEGNCAKQIAYKLDLSLFTIQDYMKEIYRRYNVTGRNELHAHFNS